MGSLFLCYICCALGAPNNYAAQLAAGGGGRRAGGGGALHHLYDEIRANSKAKRCVDQSEVSSALPREIELFVCEPSKFIAVQTRCITLRRTYLTQYYCARMNEIEFSICSSSSLSGFFCWKISCFSFVHLYLHPFPLVSFLTREYDDRSFSWYSCVARCLVDPEAMVSVRGVAQ